MDRDLGDAELLTARLVVPAGPAAYQQWAQSKSGRTVRDRDSSGPPPGTEQREVERRQLGRQPSGAGLDVLGPTCRARRRPHSHGDGDMPTPSTR